MLQSKVAQLQTPSQRVLRAVKQMFYQDGFTVLEGHAREYLDANDLIALKSPTTDPLSNYLRKARATEVSTSPVILNPTSLIPRNKDFRE